MNTELLNLQLSGIYEVFPDKPPFLSLKQAARFLRRDPRTLMADRTFPLKQSGRHYMVNTIALAKWMLRGV